MGPATGVADELVLGNPDQRRRIGAVAALLVALSAGVFLFARVGYAVDVLSATAYGQWASRLLTVTLGLGTVAAGHAGYARIGLLPALVLSVAPALGLASVAALGQVLGLGRADSSLVGLLPIVLGIYGGAGLLGWTCGRLLARGRYER